MPDDTSQPSTDTCPICGSIVRLGPGGCGREDCPETAPVDRLAPTPDGFRRVVELLELGRRLNEEKAAQQ